MVARQVITELNLIMWKSYIVNQKDHGCNWLLSVLVDIFGRRRTLITITQYFEVNNCSIDKSEHGMKYYFYDISSAFGLLFYPISSLGEIHSIPSYGSTT